jgi:hypothetical protein
VQSYYFFLYYCSLKNNNKNMTCKVQLLLLIIAIFLNVEIWGQESFGGSPRSFKLKISENVPVIELAKFDNDALLSEDARHADKGNPLRIGVSHLVNYDMNNCGTLDVLPNGDRIWRVAFKSPDAVNIEASFSKFLIPDGADLFMYNETHDYIIGSYNIQNTMEGNIFYAEAIPGDVIYMEYYEPQWAKFHGELSIDMIGHLYRSILDPYPNESGACQINVACTEANPFRKQVNSVVYMEMTTQDGDTYLCSGAMINNVRNDRTPYVYSAEHCYEGENYKTWKFYFNYQTATCSGTTQKPGYRFSIIGYEVKASGKRATSSDFLLVKITGNITHAKRDSIYFAGWDNRSVTPTVGCGIHHPNGDFKKISIPQSVIQDASMMRYWQVNWKTSGNKGVTEVGSSGSPLFNASGLIVGSLCCGQSACNLLNGKDYYGKLAYAWTNGNDYANGGNNNLKRWLDPDNIGSTTHQGMFYRQLGIEDNNYTLNCSVYPNPTSGRVTISGDFETPKGICTVFDLTGRQVHVQNITLSNSTELNLSHLSEGLYLLEIQNAGKMFRSKLLISK